MTRVRPFVSLALLCAAVACADLDGFVLNGIPCSKVADRLAANPALCAESHVCAATCEQPYDFAKWGVPQDIVQQVPVDVGGGVTVDSYFLPSSGARAEAVIVYAHGNFASVEHYLNRVALAWQTGASVYAIDYRGFGKSSSTEEPSEATFMADAAAMRSTLDALVPSGTRVFVMGYSAGALAAVEIARVTPPAGLLLENPWPNVQLFADDSTFIGVPQSFVTTGAWDNVSKLAAMDVPLLHLHGAVDDTVRVELGRQLFAAAASTEKELVVVEGAGHGNFGNDVPTVMGPDVYVARLAQFIDEHPVAPVP